MTDWTFSVERTEAASVGAPTALAAALAVGAAALAASEVFSAAVELLQALSASAATKPLATRRGVERRIRTCFLRGGRTCGVRPGEESPDIGDSDGLTLGSRTIGEKSRKRQLIS